MITPEPPPATTQPAPEGLALVQRVRDAVGPTMLLGLQDADLWGAGGTERIQAWIDWISTTVGTALAAEPPPVTAPTDLTERVATAVHAVFERWTTGLGDQRPQDAITQAVLAAVAPTELGTVAASSNDPAVPVGTLSLVERVAEAMRTAHHEWMRPGSDAGETPMLDILGSAALAAVAPELTELLDYRNRITWETTCGEHARLLDACQAADERAEQAEAQLRGLVDRLRQMTDAWERELPETIRTATAADAIRTSLESAGPARPRGDDQ